VVPATVLVVDAARLAPLIEWIKCGGEEKKPVFIRFGSMVIKDTKSLQQMIMDAAKAMNTRIMVQLSWSKLVVSGKLCFNVGPVSHDWLLPQCCAVIHHGMCC
jgi:sterol 3beta-glucosyltransferase